MPDYRMTNEEIVFQLAQCMKGLDDDPSNTGDEMVLQQLYEEAIKRKLLIDDDSWYIFDADGNNLNPKFENDDPDLGFSTKGYCWLYWVGLGMPEDTPLQCICDPTASSKKVEVMPTPENIVTNTAVVIAARKAVDGE